MQKGKHSHIGLTSTSRSTQQKVVSLFESGFVQSTLHSIECVHAYKKRRKNINYISERGTSENYQQKQGEPTREVLE